MVVWSIVFRAVTRAQSASPARYDTHLAGGSEALADTGAGAARVVVSQPMLILVLIFLTTLLIPHYRRWRQTRPENDG